MPCAKQKEVLVLLLLSMFLLFLLLVSLFSHIVLVAVVISGELLTEAKIIKPFWMLSAMQLVGTRNVRLGICNANFLHLLFTLPPLPSHSHTHVLSPFLPLLHTLFANERYAQFVCFLCCLSSRWPRVATVICEHGQCGNLPVANETACGREKEKRHRNRYTKQSYSLSLLLISLLLKLYHLFASWWAI